MPPRADDPTPDDPTPDDVSPDSLTADQPASDPTTASPLSSDRPELPGAADGPPPQPPGAARQCGAVPPSGSSPDGSLPDDSLPDRRPGAPGQPSPRQHPWAGTSPERRAEWERHREALCAGRPAARERARAAFEAFLGNDGDGDGGGGGDGGDGPSASAALSGDSEALFELSLLADRWARGLTGLALRALAGFAAARHAEPDPAKVAGQSGRPAEDYLAEEVALAFNLAPRSGGDLLCKATELAGRLPATLAALETGTIDLPRAHAVLEVTETLDPDKARTVEDSVLAKGGRPSRGAFRQALRRAADKADPDAAAERARARRADPHAWKRRPADGVADVGGTLPAEIAEACWQRLTGLARYARTPDDTRTLGQTRVDVLAALILGFNSGDLRRCDGRTVPIEVHVSVSAETLAGLDDEPGHLAGHGPIPADLARTLAEHAHWRRILYDPVDGSLLDVGRRRFATAALRDHVRTRDRLCRIPGCPQPATTCDLDHTDEHNEGGDTRDGNLGPFCRRHHRMKGEDTGWSIRQPEPGRFVVTTPTGRTYTSNPEPPCNPEPPWTDPTEHTTTRRTTPSTPGRREHPPTGPDDWDDLPSEPSF